ncbi:hypothetical protein H257_15462 [Aphanomyces astaci]|uniref:Uncharacterized protein n=1 Tax=Aphanomyces astaci TaxID=112090 RepID=W4FNZ6_APHAT|nr:hypothetical protein H257_15462 [Aphanomyces astaci]ETV68656.1 hypothetical protein H257_15462 [Aphanomyces astaci]|eukprot:XP_009841881.1 hypothetical protein H257_15462 [Aphanomyces astaci]
MSHRLSVPDTPEPERLKPSSLQCHVSDFGSSPQAVVSAAAMSLKSKVSMASLTSSMVKANPKVHRVPTDRSHVASFQKLLSSFDEGDNALRIVTTLNSLLQSIVSAVVTDIDNAKIAREASFVRGYFILETLELDQVVASLEDSLDQAYVRVQALQDELKAMVHTHKRKIAEAKLMAVIHDATYD